MSDGSGLPPPLLKKRKSDRGTQDPGEQVIGGKQVFTPLTLLRLTSHGHFVERDHVEEKSDADGDTADETMPGHLPQFIASLSQVDEDRGEEEQKGTGGEGGEEDEEEDGFKCEICIDKKTKVELTPFCTNEECSSQLCKGCVEQFICNVIESSRYAVPPVRCPSCFHRIPTPKWRKCLFEDDLFEKYAHNAHSLLSLRCSGCDALYSEVVKNDDVIRDPEERKVAAEEVFGEMDAELQKSVKRIWKKFLFLFFRLVGMRLQNIF